MPDPRFLAPVGPSTLGEPADRNGAKSPVVPIAPWRWARRAARGGPDRGDGPVIGDGTMIDNPVQIGHNVVIGRCCVIVAQVGISGSTKLDDFVVVGGQGGLAGHLKLGKGARAAAHGGAFRDGAPGETVCGFPALPSKEFWRGVAVLQRRARKKG
jgi:UDP-3-O-[3-hydroxymyristoyl] glucosamine N-acyltransferase